MTSPKRNPWKRTPLTMSGSWLKEVAPPPIAASIYPSFMPIQPNFTADMADTHALSRAIEGVSHLEVQF